MEFAYTYTIAPEFDTEAFWQTAAKLDMILPQELPRELILDPFNEFLIQIYGTTGSKVRVVCDWEIGAVFVESDINLDAVLRADTEI